MKRPTPRARVAAASTSVWETQSWNWRVIYAVRCGVLPALVLPGSGPDLAVCGCQQRNVM